MEQHSPARQLIEAESPKSLMRHFPPLIYFAYVITHEGKRAYVDYNGWFSDTPTKFSRSDMEERKKNPAWRDVQWVTEP